MKIEMTTSVLAGLLLTDPSMAQAVALRKKKEDITDSESTADILRARERTKNPEESHPNGTISSPSSHQTTEQAMGSGGHVVEMKTESKQRGTTGARAGRRRPGHGFPNVADTDDVAADFLEENDFDYDGNEELDIFSTDDTPDVGVLADNSTAALDRKLQQKIELTKGALRCFRSKILPVSLKKRQRRKFTAPFCDQNFGNLAYWTLQNYLNFFLGGYCECDQVCSNAKVSPCCAQGCFQCKNGDGSNAFQTCGHYRRPN